jgi:predicted outer membrane repeat protein
MQDRARVKLPATLQGKVHEVSAPVTVCGFCGELWLFLNNQSCNSVSGGLIHCSVAGWLFTGILVFTVSYYGIITPLPHVVPNLD